MFPVADSPALRLTLTGGLLVVGSLMLSQSLYGVIQSLYMRGDLDLLLSSPLPVGRMLTVRALAVMMNAIGVWALLSLPFVNMLMLFGQFRWISVYPMLFAMGLTATALGLALAMLLFATLGPALTRTTAQVLAALIGVTAFMVSQAQTFLPAGQRAAVAAWAAALPERLGPDSAVWLPARALLGGAGPLLVCIAGRDRAVRAGDPGLLSRLRRQRHRHRGPVDPDGTAGEAGWPDAAVPHAAFARRCCARNGGCCCAIPGCCRRS